MRHLSSMHSARQQYVKAESSERIARALRAKTRTSTEETIGIKAGDKVYFYRNGNWHGPGTFVGRDGKVCFLRNGSNILKVHETELKVYKNGPIDVNFDMLDSSGTPISSKPAIMEKVSESSSNQQNGDMTVYDLDSPKQNSSEILRDVSQQTPSKIVNEPETEEAPDTRSGKEPVSEVSVMKKVLIPKPNDHIEIFSHNWEFPVTARVMNRAGKMGGKHENWMNIEYTGPEEYNGQRGAMNFATEVSHWEHVNQEDVITLATMEDDFEVAKKKELMSWRSNDVYTPCENLGQPSISTKWVLTIKDDGSLKARLVVKGFEDPDENCIIKDSPTCSKDTFRLLISICSSQTAWQHRTIDISTAFLQGESINREVYLVHPEEAGVINARIRWKLNKCVYGLKDAARRWFERVKKEVIKLGGKQSTLDPCVFFWRNGEERIQGILSSHVDDFWISGEDQFVNGLITSLKSSFTVGKMSILPDKYLGIHIKVNTSGELQFDQREYTE